MMFRFTSCLAVLVALIPGGQAQVPGAVVAVSGFNDQEGVNRDATPDSPYKFSETVKGRGASEPGWDGNNWYAGDCCDGGAGRGIAEADSTLEGDGVLRMNGAPSTGEAWAYRLWGRELPGPILIEQYVRLPADGFFQSRPGKGGVGSLIGPHWKVEDGKFLARDGDGSGYGPFEDTGFLLVPNFWHKVATLVYPDTETYDFFVDDVRYEAPDPLNFRGNPDYIDRVDYLSQTVAWVDYVQITVIPEPSTFVMLGTGVLGLLWFAWRKRSADGMRRVIVRLMTLTIVGFAILPGGAVQRPANAATVPGLIAHYSFDDTFDDSSPNLLHAHPGVFGVPTFNSADKQFGSASADFEGDDLQHLCVNHSAAFENLSQATVAMWLKPESWHRASRIFQKSPFDGDFSLRRNGFGGQFMLQTAGLQLDAGDTVALLPPGRWHHVTAVFDEYSDLMKLYKDGVEIASDGMDGKEIKETTYPMYIAHKMGHDDAGDNFDGLMDEFFVFADALDETQIKNLMNFNTPIPEPSSLLLLSMGAVGLLAYAWRRRRYVA